MAVKCWDCGDEGHVANACPNAVYMPAGGTWCGSCDERTRLVDLGGKMRRCSDCHPLHGQHLRQHRNCAGCHAIVYVWDHAPCSQHQAVGIQREHVDVKSHQEPKDLRALALAQAAESRHER